MRLGICHLTSVSYDDCFIHFSCSVQSYDSRYGLSLYKDFGLNLPFSLMGRSKLLKEFKSRMLSIIPDVCEVTVKKAKKIALSTYSVNLVTSGTAEITALLVMKEQELLAIVLHA